MKCIDSLYTAVSINDLETSPNFNVFPNPSSDQINVVGDNIEQVTILDLRGRSLITIMEQFNHIDLRILPKGVYLIQIKSAMHFFQKRLVVQ